MAKLCNHTGITGYVSNQDLMAYDNTRPLYSHVVCDRQACIDYMSAKVLKATGEPAIHVLYPKASA